MLDSVVSVNMQGGLGNMMFQSAFALAFSFEKNCQHELLNFYKNCEDNHKWLNRNSNHYDQSVFRYFNKQNFASDSIIHESAFHYEYPRFVSGKKNIYNGYFQSEKYFFDFKDQIKAYFSPSSENLEYIYSKYNLQFEDYISLHIRRGDYVKQPEHHPCITQKYIYDSIQIFGSNSKFLVFSDDILWAKKSILREYNCIFIENELDYICLYMMSLCSGNIISNSSFSWWGAYLNKNTDNLVVRPNIWFGPKYNHLNTIDICPENWMIKSV